MVLRNPWWHWLYRRVHHTKIVDQNAIVFSEGAGVLAAHSLPPAMFINMVKPRVTQLTACDQGRSLTHYSRKSSHAAGTSRTVNDWTFGRRRAVLTEAED